VVGFLVDVASALVALAAGEAPPYPDKGRLLGAKDKLRGIYPDAGHDFPDDSRKAAYEWLDR
jgi:hypothetical protein